MEFKKDRTQIKWRVDIEGKPGKSVTQANSSQIIHVFSDPQTVFCRILSAEVLIQKLILVRRRKDPLSTC